jgi:hypothetical protein
VERRGREQTRESRWQLSKIFRDCHDHQHIFDGQSLTAGRGEQDQFFSQNKPRKISLKNKRLLDDYLFTSNCEPFVFGNIGFRWKIENKLCFLRK